MGLLGLEDTKSIGVDGGIALLFCCVSLNNNG